MLLDLLSTNSDWIQTVVRLIFGIVFFGSWSIETFLASSVGPV
jgi:hypothetical protein